MEPIRYLALGDSYTIGTGLIDPSGSFPSLLARRLSEATGIPVDVLNLGVNGYTTADLIREELPVARSSRAEIVTVLIGANDIVQRVGAAAYRHRLAHIYEAIRELGLPSDRVVAISTPDFSALPGAAPFGTPAELHERVSAFNRLARSEAEERGFGFVDIAAINPRSNGEADWLAADNLHPGPAQHRAFADRIWDAARERWLAVRSDTSMGRTGDSVA
ncbi:MAG TPA: SGNH/GDSL hydrolase family protein [Candidatus Acidoferrum sp.]|nr:SGNH/GDSL hydrolase family protein [Candidatus Acidoferrum sp.]